MKNRTLRELTEEEIVGRIGGTVRAWRGVEGAAPYEDVPGFCVSASLDVIEEHDFVLTPGRYVGAAEAEVDPDAESVEERIARLTVLLREQFAESERLAKLVDEQLGRV
jgi:type I restriction enzyme M protein